jgi:Zn-dependent oligopeptidase
MIQPMATPTAPSASSPASSFSFDPDSPPRFDRFSPEQIVPTVRALIQRQDEARAALEASLSPTGTPTWESLPAAVSALAEPLSYVWGLVHHLLSV